MPAKICLRFKPRYQYIFILILTAALLGTSAWAADKNKLTVINQSGEDTTVKIMGVRDWLMDIPSGQERTIILPAGNFQYLVRYGDETNYRYNRGPQFQIEQTRIGFTEASLTLISAPSQGQKDPLLIEEFNRPLRLPPGPSPETKTTPAQEKSGETPLKDEFILHRVKAGETLPSIAQWYSGEAKLWSELAKYNLDLDPLHLKPGTTVKIPIYLATVHKTPAGAKTLTPPPKPHKKIIPPPLAPPPALPKASESPFGPK